MRLTKYLIVLIAVAIIATVIFDKNLFSRSLFNLFMDKVYTEEGLERVVNFDPDNDILFLPELENKDFFQSVNDLSICRRREVRKFVYIYLTTGRNYVKRSIENSDSYLRVIEEIIKKNDIPMDISLLPLLESGFNPYAVSRSKAVGLWQFIQGTSVRFGLKTDRWLDERRDIEKSTHAAIRHLKNLYNIFDNWELSLAAYNGGAGHVKRAMLKTGKECFWELRKTGRLCRETSEYVARFAALLLIYKNQEIFDNEDELNLIEIPETEKIVLEYPVNINRISKISGISARTLRKLNPQLKRNITPPYYKKYTLRLPAEAKERLKKNKKIIYRIKFTRLKRHTVRKGESIYKIAKRYRIRPTSIIMINDLKNPNLIHPGFKLYIPI